MMNMHETLMDAISIPLPDEKLDLISGLWSEFLSWLPVKDLLKLRRICKLWCSIIDSLYFIYLHHRHYHNNNNNNNLLMIEKVVTKGEIEFKLTVCSSQSFEKLSQHVFKISGSLNILANCKELMLITKSSLYHGSKKILWLWNPSIRKTLQVTCCPLRPKNKYDFIKFLLGFSPFEDDFKLFAFRFNHGRALDVSIAVYSLRNHGWESEIKRVSLIVCFPQHHVRPHIVFSGGVAYWMGHDNDSFNIYSATHLISFDFDSEDFGFVELPDARDDRVKRRFIFLLGESVAVLSVSAKSSCIWVLGKDGGFRKEPWRVWPSTQSNLINCKLLQGGKYATPRLIYDQKTDTFFMHSSRMVISYNITTHQFQLLVKSSCVGHLVVEPYAESLILRKGTSGQTSISFP